MRLVDTSAGPDACWPWKGCLRGGPGKRDRRGTYGGFRLGKMMGAHRVAFILANGDPGDAKVLHECDFGLCCNPAHLSAGTQLKNVREAIDRGRLKRISNGRFVKREAT